MLNQGSSKNKIFGLAWNKEKGKLSTVTPDVREIRTKKEVNQPQFTILLA